MSRSPDDSAPDSVAPYARALQQVGEMVREGRSFSGHERNCGFLNLGDGRFADISGISGVDLADDGRSLALVDWDRDGDQDLWITNRSGPQVRLLRNDAASGHWLQVRLRGRTSNRDGIGARVSVRSGADAAIVRTARAGEGFLGQSSRWLNFGLGDAATPIDLEVRWPSGRVDRHADLVVDRRYIVVEGGTARPQSSTPQPALAAGPVAPAERRAGTRRTVLVSPVPLPELAYRRMDGERASMEVRGRPLLVNLWASWCAPCRRELESLTAGHARLQEAGIDVLALAVDGLDPDDDTDEARAPELIAEIGARYPTGRATASLLDVLQVVVDSIFDLRVSLGVPTSLLIDGQGRLTIVYRGVIELDELLADRALLGLEGRRLRRAAAPFDGRFRTSYREPARIVPIARALAAGERLDQAIAYLERNRADAVRDPDYRLAVAAQGFALLAAERWSDAAARYRELLRVDPEDPVGHFNLALALFELGHDAEAEQHLGHAEETARARGNRRILEQLSQR